MAAWRGFCADDPEQDAADLARAERQLEELQYRPWKTEAQRLEIRRGIEALERHLPRMRENAGDAA